MVKVKEIKVIEDEVYHYTSGYYTTNKWLDNDTVLLVRSDNIDFEANGKPGLEIVSVNVITGEKKVLCNDLTDIMKCAVEANICVYGTKIYYTTGSELVELDSENGKKRTVYKNEYVLGKDKVEKGTEGKPAEILSPHITNDGKYISLYIEKNDRPSVFLRVDVESGKAEKVYEKIFEYPFYWPNHLMICPEDKDLFFFSHEGNTFYVSNRLWLYDARTKQAWNIAKQRLDADGNLGDCYGHEMWAPDGNGLYFVKYVCSPIPPRGICYVDIKTGKTELLYSGFNYWHVGTSQNGRFVLADTMDENFQSNVVAIDRTDDTEVLVDTVKTNWVHPSHPHPQMSPDCSKLIYSALNSKGMVCTKVAFLDV